MIGIRVEVCVKEFAARGLGTFRLAVRSSQKPSRFPPECAGLRTSAPSGSVFDRLHRRFPGFGLDSERVHASPKPGRMHFALRCSDRPGRTLASSASVPGPGGKMNSVSEITGNASLMLFFATDTGTALTAPVIRVTPTVFFMAKTIRSLTVILCFIAEQHCSATELICFTAWKFFSLKEVALPAPETHCSGVKQH